MPRSKADSKQSKMKKKESSKKTLASQKITRKSAPVTTGKIKSVKTKRMRPGQAAIREIKKYQQSSDLLIRRAPLQRRIRQIAKEYSQIHYYEKTGEAVSNFRFQPEALRAIQEALEGSIVSLYEDAYLCTHHAKRVTLFESDIQLARIIRGDSF